jgi:hypothetical protein
MTGKRTAVLLMLLWVGGAGAFLRLRGLGEYAFSPDDLKHLLISAFDTLPMVWDASLPSTHPPLIYVILHGMIRVSRDELFLRCISLLPGVGLIFVSYLLGRKTAGRASGIAMALLAAFGFGTLILSQVLRAYMGSLFFLSLALWFLFNFLEKGRKKHLLGYAVSMLFAVGFHYSIVIPLAAIGLVCMARGIHDRKDPRRYRAAFLIHLPFIGLAGFFAYLFASNRLDIAFQGALAKTYLARYYPTSFPQLLHNLNDFFAYLTLPPEGPLPPGGTWMIVLVVLGFLACLRRSRIDMGAMIFAVFAISVLLSFCEAYPFGGIRQSIYLFPFAGLSAGTAVQSILEFLREKTGRLVGTGWTPRLEKYKRFVPFLALGAIVAFSTAWAVFHAERGFLRRYTMKSLAEFPLTHEEYARLLGYLTENRGKRDVILTNRQTSKYLLYELFKMNRKDFHQFPDNLKRTSYKGMRAFFIDSWFFINRDRLDQALARLQDHVDFRKARRIWIINIGWWDAIQGFLSADPVFKEAARGELLVKGGGYVLAFDGPTLLGR